MGSSKKQTVGYWQKFVLLYGICRSPIDAFLEFRGGNRTAWSGMLTSSATLSISAPELWGGEKTEGGIVGSAAVMFGEQTQAPNAYLRSNLSSKLSALRGKLCFGFLGGRWGTTPYPKAPAFKVRRILKGWDNDTPWYPEKAIIPLGIEQVAGSTIPELGDTSGNWRYLQVANSNPADYSSPAFDDSSWAIGQMPFASLNNHIYTAPSGFPANYNTFWPVNTTLWLRKTVVLPPAAQVQMQILIDNFATIWVNGHMVLGPESGHDGEPNLELNFFTFNIPGIYLVAGENSIVIKAKDTGLWTYVATRATGVSTYRLGAMNPAHIIYDTLTQSEMQGEPVDTIDEAAFTAAADRFYNEGFGLCTIYNHQQETVEQFQDRILNVVAANLTESRVDGRYRLDPVRGDYDPDSLPILADADILEFVRDPSNPNDAVNEVVVEWFDPERKEKRVTAPLQSMGAIMACGAVISETTRCPEVPDEALANRCAARFLNDKATPNTRFNLTTTRRTYSWRAGMPFRLQAPRRGIADMICLVGEIRAGTMRSGAMTMTVMQEVSHMPDSTYVEIQPGVDTSPSQTPAVPVAQMVMEAPYLELAGVLPNSELAALTADVGYLLAMAARPSSGMNYGLWTKLDGADFADQGVNDWCPTGLVVEAATIDPAEVEFTLGSRTDLDRVEVGTAALWGSELVRVDAIDSSTGAVTFGRAVGDTVIQPHSAGERVWFYDAWGATDQREYVAGEVVKAKMLTRTSTQQLAIDLAPESSLEMDQRAARPYPPGRVRMNALVNPSALSGEITVTWAHRDRVLQADQLLDTETDSIGPESGTTYTLRWYLADVLETTHSGVSGVSQAYTPSAEGYVRMELESVRDGLASWQMHVREFYYTPTPADFLGTEAGDLVTLEDGSPITLE